MEPARIPTYSVRGLNELVNRVLAEAVGTVLVEGELSNVQVRKGKWLLFDLKDSDSTVNCFASVYSVGLRVEDGMRVRILGTPRLYVPYGKYSLTVDAIEAVGAGALQQAYEALYRSLEAEGLFAPERKRPLPAYPERIGIVTSAEGAAIDDVRRILRDRWGGVALELYPVAVQGMAAAAEVVRAIQYFNDRAAAEVVIVTRGGGSPDDLQAFQDERVARAIFGSRIPVIAAIGHEKDVTIAELVADARGATPSHAAQLAVPDRGQIRERIDAAAARLSASMGSQLTDRRTMLDTSLQTASLRLREACRRTETSIGDAARRLGAASRTVAQYDARLAAIDQVLRSLSPARILARGYSFTTDRRTGRLVRTIQGIGPGTPLRTTVADGSILSEVIDAETTTL